MTDQQTQKSGISKGIRALQLLFLLAAVWFIYWAHVQPMVVWNKTFIESLSSVNVIFYLISLFAIFFTELLSKKFTRDSVHSPPVATSNTLLVKPNQPAMHGTSKSKQMPSHKIGVLLLIFGALLLLYSIILASTILTLIGLSLTFWGVLFLFVRPTSFVRADILDSTVLSFYKTIDRALDDLHYTGNSVHIPPYPKEAYLPEHLKGLKELVVFISANDTVSMPAIEELVKSQFLVKNPEGLCITPPGSELLSIFETELKMSFTKIDRESLYDSLQRLIVDTLELAADFEIEPENDSIHVKITHSVYRNLYSKERMLKSVHVIGCPLTSAIACALATTIGKPVTIIKSNVTPDLKTVDIWYQTIGG
ncbi:MAG: hypothetical protein NWF06_05450 [Candidatus Bathyarchaeota archaeon]|nr:hypothetical protein [Candidatus Bathyarchaeum sp.]